MTSLLDKANIEVALLKLKNNKSNLNANNSAFADKLIDFYTQNDKLSYKQMFWVNKLADQKDANASNTTVNEDNSVVVGSLSKVEELMENASKKIKLPGIIVEVTGVGKVMVGIPYNKNDKGLEVCIKTGSYSGYKFIGSVEEDRFYPKNRYYTASPRVIDLLMALSKDPINTLLEYGKTTGVCAWCGSSLEDPKSIKRGVGPICMKNYGLILD